MDRHRLDAFAARHRLSPAATVAALELTGARPDAPAWRAFAATVLRAAGVGGIGAGIVFFVAANWQDYGVLGRFVLLQAALLVSVAVALRRPPPATLGSSALLMATLVTGALLALFGQSYQTGADLYELFFTWAALALPFALAGLSGAVWAVWWAVLNVGLGLMCGWLGLDHALWRLLDGRSVGHAALLMLPCVIDLLAAAAFVALRETRFAAAAPGWLARFLACLGIAYGTAAMLSVVTGAGWHGDSDATRAQGPIVVLTFAIACALVAFDTWRRRGDVFPMALLGASGLAISTTTLAHALRFDDIGSFFVTAIWLLAASAAIGMLLMHWSRTWDTTEGARR